MRQSFFLPTVRPAGTPRSGAGRRPVQAILRSKMLGAKANSFRLRK